MADGTVVIDTDLDSSGIESKIGKLGSVASKGLGAVTAAVGAVSTALVGVGGVAVKVGMGFESSMSQVAATMGITVDEIANGSEAFELLEKAAKNAGATTQFSASQSAEALNYLALAGYEAKDAASALPTVLNLAAAGGLELAYASDLVTDSMSALGLEMGDLEGFTDKLAKTSQKSNTSVAQLGEAILTVGGTAKALAGGTTELNAVLGILADNSIKGSEGGTALRNIILSLSAPTDTAAKKMKELGLEAFDAEGNMRPLNDTFNDLNDILSSMTQEEQTQVLNELFNKTDLRSVNALLANSGDRFNELSGYIDSAEGAASNMAETMNDNLKGKLTILGSSLEGLGIQIYESLDVGLKGAVESAIDSVGRLSEAFENNGFDGLIDEAGKILSDFMVKIAEYAPQVVNTAIQLIQSFISSIQQNLPTIVQSAIQIAESLIHGILQMLPQILQMGIDIIVELAKGLAQTLPTLVPVAIDAIITLAETLIDNLDTLVDAGIELIFALVDGLITALPTLIEKVPEIINKFWEAFDRNLFKIVQAGMELIVKLGKGIIDNIPVIIANAGEIVNAIWNTISHINLLKLGGNLMTNLGNGIKNMVGSIKSRAGNIADTIKNTIANTNVAQVGKDLMTKLSSGIKGMVSSVATTAKTIGKNIVEGVWNGINAMKDWIANKISGFFSGILNSAKKVLGIHSPSRVFRDEVGKYMAEGVGVGFEQETDNVKQDMQTSLTDLTAKMKATVEYEQSNYIPTGATKYNSTHSVNNGETSDDERTIVVEATFNVDGRQMAKATATHMDRELNKISDRKKRGG